MRSRLYSELRRHYARVAWEGIKETMSFIALMILALSAFLVFAVPFGYFIITHS